MKLNRKGFMMAEVIVVSAIVLVFLSSLYLSYNNLYSAYSSRVDYYDAITLYKLAYHRDLLVKEGISDELEYARNNSVKLLDYGSDKLLIIYNNKSNLTDTIITNSALSNIKKTFKDYLSYVATSVNLKNTNYVMFMEKCNNTDDCKYAYMEYN